MRLKSEKQQRLDAELGLIIDEMARAIYNANREWVARSDNPLTLHMNEVLSRFQTFCQDNYGAKHEKS